MLEYLLMGAALGGYSVFGFFLAFDYWRYVGEAESVMVKFPTATLLGLTWPVVLLLTVILYFLGVTSDSD